MDLAGSYTSLNLSNPLVYLCSSSLCYIVTGVTLLVVGVIITSVSFQNLESYHQGNKERYAGPVLIGAGILVMGKDAVFRLKECECQSGLHSIWKKLRRRLALLSVDLPVAFAPQMYVFVLSGSSQILRQAGGRMDNLATLAGRGGRWTLTGNDSKLFIDRVLKSTLCHLIMGGSLLLAGVLVTASTLHGNNDNVHGHLFVIGPILLVAGMFALSRVMFKRAKIHQRRRRGCRRLREDRAALPGTGGESPGEDIERQSTDTAIYLEPAGFGEHSYQDSPPPYEVVAGDQSYLVPARQSSLCAHGGAMDNPALEDNENNMPPPSYDEVIHMQRHLSATGVPVPPPYVPQSASRQAETMLVADPDSGCSMASHVSITAADFSEDCSRVPSSESAASRITLANLDTMQQTQV